MKKVIYDGEMLFASDGELLSDLLMRCGKSAEHPCGGRGLCGKCAVLINGKRELSCKYKVNSDITVSSIGGEILSETGAEENGTVTDNICLVLDIGTTTLALALVSLDEKRIVRVITRTNPQRVFGADVISRIDYCTKNSPKKLQEMLIFAINKMIADLNICKVDKLYISGNTTMLHLFFGEDCSNMGVAPYKPVFLEGREVNTESLGIVGVKTVESLPCVSAFVGADIVAGMNFVGIPEKSKYSLLVDLGTNAEIVLMNENGSVSTSAAAGPCFEGANISCGISAVEGAICRFSSDGYETVGNVKARGICGTGLVDIVAYLLEKGIVDETGLMNEGTFEVAESITVTQEDVRQYQLAKSAIYSAIMSLVKYNTITPDDIETVYISGGFSAMINAENAIRTGLFPAEFEKRCVPVNNSSLLGTVRYALEHNDISALVAKTKYIDLSADAYFSDMFINNMLF